MRQEKVKDGLYVDGLLFVLRFRRIGSVFFILLHFIIIENLQVKTENYGDYRFSERTDTVVAKEATKETTETQKEADSKVLALTVDSLACFLLGST